MFLEPQKGTRRKLPLAWPMLALLASLALTGGALAAGSKTLPGHVPAVVAQLTASGTLPLTNRLNLAIGLPLRNTVELKALLARLYDPTSPDYRHYLTAGQFTERFGPSREDYEAVTDFARQNHLAIRKANDSRMLLDVGGSVADIQQAFHLTLKVYHHPKENRDFYAPDVEPSVDETLPIADISGLNNYGRPHPNTQPNPGGFGTKPGTGSGKNGTYWGNDFRAAYLPGVTLTGSNQIVGILEFDGYYPGDITAYAAAAGVRAVPLVNVYADGYNGQPNLYDENDGNGEVSLDIEMVMDMAPGLSTIVMFEGGTNSIPNDVLNTMADFPDVNQFSSSWTWNGGPSTTTDNIFLKMIAQGRSYFTAAGDSDAYTVGANSINGVDNPLNVTTPASSPYITVVGGTTLTTAGKGGPWASETVWNWGQNPVSGAFQGGSGGVSSFYPIPYWQTNINTYANGASPYNRNLPDVAWTADNIYVEFGNGSSNSFGGTSCATPLWAALAALINQQSVALGRGTIGFINPAIYAIGNSTNYTKAFHDIVTGNNANGVSPDYYYAFPGFDLCTGLGTPIGQGLIDALTGVPIPPIVAPVEPLECSPANGFAATGYVGGPFNINSELITLNNVGTNTLTWSASSTPKWLTLTPTHGPLVPNSSTFVTASLFAASGLPAGTNASAVMITDAATGAGQTYEFVLQIIEALAILPATGITVGGEVHGPFTGVPATITLTNLGAVPLNWTITNSFPSWLTVAPTNGTLATKGSANVTATLTPAAFALPGGSYTNFLSFYDVTGQVTQTRPVVLNVGQSIVKNGGFETGTFANWTLVGNGDTDDNLYDGVESTNTGYPLVVHSGTYGAYLGDVQLATLSQNLATIPGHSYLLSFWVDNPTAGAGEQFLVNWITNGASASQIYNVVNPPAFGWTNLTAVLTATGTNTVLQFGAENVPNAFGLDDVSVTPIPNPAVAALTLQGNSVIFSMVTTPGIQYQLLYATNLLQTNWVSLGTNAATTTALTVTNSTGSDQQRFYRVRELP